MTQNVMVSARAGERLDRCIADERPDVSRAYARKLIDDGAVTVDDRPAKAGQKLNGHERIAVVLPDPVSADPQPQALPITLLYEDDDLAVVDKPAGMVVHPAAGHEDGTLVNALLSRFGNLPGISGTRRPGIVHRLDKDTSGCLIVAKSSRGEVSISRQIRDQRVTKIYLALVAGLPDPQQGRIEAPIGRDPRHRQQMAIVTDGRSAQTEYRVQQIVGSYSLVECRLVTGRTHQIRVHLKGIGHPVVGDPVYGVRAAGLGRQFLHAHRVVFRRPSDGLAVDVTSPLPEDLASFLIRIGNQSAIAAV